MFPKFPTPENTEVIPCLVVVDESGLNTGKFREVLEILKNTVNDTSVVRDVGNKLRIGHVIVGSTVEPVKPQDIKFLVTKDWDYPISSQIVPSQGKPFILAKAIVNGLYGIRHFANDLRADGVRVFPPLVYVLTRREPQDNHALIQQIAAYTKKATGRRRLVMKWFYLPQVGTHASTETFATFVAQPDDVHLLKDEDVITSDQIKRTIVNYISQSINSFIDSLSLPQQPATEEDEEHDELTKIMEQEDF